MSHCKIHNVRFYIPEPRAIRCMAVYSPTKTLAVSRSDASVELWNLRNKWFIERIIVSTPENFSIEGLAWCGNRLFSVGLHGFLIEYDLYKLAIKNQITVTGEAAFCLDIHQDRLQIAVGTEQGYLNIFKIEEDGIVFEKFLDKQEGRILCIKFSSSGEYVVSGSIDAIRIWNVQSGHAIHRMTTGRSESHKPTIVWCLEITNDFTIISGDSRGKLSFWDGKTASQIVSYQSHKSDILSLCLSEDESNLYCAGVDPSIINYVRISVKDNAQKWVKSIERRKHDHDVNALVMCGNKLYSGGADGYLACSYFPPYIFLKTPPLLQNSCVTVSAQARYLMLRYPKFVEVWSLGKPSNVENDYMGIVSLECEPKKLFVLQRATKDYNADEEYEGVIYSCMSEDGKWIMFSTCSGTRLFQFIYDDEKPDLLKVEDLEKKDIPCLQATFTSDCSQLVTASNDGSITVYDLKDYRASVAETIINTGLTHTISFLKSSHCGQYLIAADVNSNIVVWYHKKKKWTQHYKLPRYQCPPTALAVHPLTSYLVVVYSDNKIVEYDIANKSFTDFSRQLENFTCKQSKTNSDPIRNVTFDPRVEHIIILHNDSMVIVLNKQKDLHQYEKLGQKAEQTEQSKLSVSSGNPKSKHKRNKKMPKIEPKEEKDEDEEKSEVEQEYHTVIKKYQHLVHLDWLADDEMVAVEINPLTLIEQLPPAFAAFGTFGHK